MGLAFSVCQQPTHHHSITDTYRCLRFQSGPLEAKFTEFYPHTQLASSVTKAVFKPQKRLQIFKNNIISQHIHQLVMAFCCTPLLNSLDIQIRKNS